MANAARGAIRPDEVYPKGEIPHLTGWGDGALRAARRNGLQLMYLHGRVFVSGAALIDYIESAADREPPTAGK